ncbi:MAG: DUF4935 domain-containing protein, partial [Crocinitomicaceae bacterium]|nr:DUF4935 domain-containing protein [Crocinitomicaceae bacterium]
MNIFVDTSVLYKDPFWKRNFSTELLETVTNREIGLFVSEIVLKELEHNYKKILNTELSQIQNIQEKLTQYQIKTDSELPKIDITKSIKGLQYFYQKLEYDGTLTVLKNSDNLMAELVDRAIERKKPFTENKTELKDALIWFAYYKHAESNNLKDCVFLTNNITDFCDIEKKN